MNFMFTLNAEEIPTPYSGEFLRDQGGAQITLTRELLGPDCKEVILKVIAVTKDKLPSEVAYKRYTIKEGLAKKPVTGEEDRIITVAPNIGGVTSSGNADYIDNAKLDDLFNVGGSNSVQSSPGEGSDNLGDMFGNI